VLAWAGRDLDTLARSLRMAHRQLGAAFAISVGVQLLDALDAISRCGIAHIEVRPDHVLVTADGTVTLVDFGYSHSDLPHTHTLTSPAMRPIRCRYLAPEQARGQTIEHRTDVFAAAGLICELVANQHPLPHSDSEFETLQAVIATTQQASPHLPPAVRAPIQAALAMQSEQRPSASELRHALIAGARAARLEIGPHVIAQTLVELGVPA
jgi:serine/threonine-protein kinase